MPANLTPDYLAAERDFKAAHTPAEKIEALERMLATLPKHKGTEKLQADIRKRLSQARKDSQKKGATAHSAPFYLVEREGVAQVALVGPPNSGKSQLLAALTHARPAIGEYPFTTRLPLPGMMIFENVHIQLVDLPPLSPEFMEPWLPQVVRAATALALVAGLDDPGVLDGIEFVKRTLEEWRAPQPRLLIANKVDVPGADTTYSVLEEMYGDRFRWMVAVSATAGHNLEALARIVFQALDLVRVYTKAPGKKADLGTPYVLKRGETVIDAARHVHKDFAEHLKYARLYHISGERDGMMVERTHPLEDQDILEFHL